MTPVLLALAVLCFGSFAWAIKGFFRQSGEVGTGMRFLQGLGAANSVLNLVLIWRASPGPTGLALTGAALYAGALGLFWWTIRTNQKRPLTLAYSKDAPEHLVTDGPYRRIRHPFYTSYTLAWLAGVFAAECPWLLASVAVFFGLYWRAASLEEKKFSTSALATSYGDYRKRTGMFLPGM